MKNCNIIGFVAGNELRSKIKWTLSRIEEFALYNSSRKLTLTKKDDIYEALIKLCGLSGDFVISSSGLSAEEALSDLQIKVKSEMLIWKRQRYQVV